MHIAILEDDAEQRELMALWLEGVQHTSRGFGTWADCIDALKQERFDLLLLDWMLPDGNGADVLAMRGGRCRLHRRAATNRL